MGFGGIEILDACQLHQFPQNENKDEEGIGLNGTGVARFVGAPVGFLKELVAYASLLASLQQGVEKGIRACGRAIEVLRIIEQHLRLARKNDAKGDLQEGMEYVEKAMKHNQCFVLTTKGTKVPQRTQRVFCVFCVQFLWFLWPLFVSLVV